MVASRTVPTRPRVRTDSAELRRLRAAIRRLIDKGKSLRVSHPHEVALVDTIETIRDRAQADADGAARVLKRTS